MKLFHLSDLHLGKRLNGYSLVDDQRYILGKILEMVDEEKPDVILICGDVYDKAIPPADAVTLFDDFLWDISCRCVPALIISGNHDSAERLSFGSRILEGGGIHISRLYEAHTPPITLEDEFGPVRFYLLPFVKPVHVRQALTLDHPDEAEAIRDYDDAVRAAIAHMHVDKAQRNVLLAHQFVTGSERSESEEINVGGIDDVGASAFEPFDYVALGHLHSPQKVGRETMRYCGTPLKYSFSEARQHKSVTVVEMGEKGKVALRLLPLEPFRDLREIRGTYDELMSKQSYEGSAVDDYLHVTLTDEDDVPYAVDRLRAVYPNLMQLSYDNLRTRESARIEDAAPVEKLSPVELLGRLYESQNNQPMDERQLAYVQAAVEKIWEEES